MNAPHPITDADWLREEIDELLGLARDRRATEAVARAALVLEGAAPEHRPTVAHCHALLRWFAGTRDGQDSGALTEAMESAVRLHGQGHEDSLDWAWSALGFAMGVSGNLGTGLQWVERTILAACRRGDSLQLRRALSNKGSLLLLSTNHEQALEVLSDVLRMFDELDPCDADRFVVHNNIASSAVMWARSMDAHDTRRASLAERALRDAGAALAGFEQQGNPARVAWALANIGHAQALLGHHSAAESTYLRGLATGDSRSRFHADISVNYARLLTDLGRYAEAEQRLDAVTLNSTPEMEPAGDLILETRVRLNVLAGRPQAALEWSERRFRRLERHYEARSRSVLAQAEILREMDGIRASELVAREQVTQADARARETDAASAAKSQFLAHMSHEIRTPINAIVGLTQLLQRDPMPPQVSKHVDAIREAGDSLRHIIDDILDFSKMEAGQFRLDHQPLMIETLLQRVESILKTAAAAKGLAWRAQGSQTAIGPVMGDAARLEQVLLNLAGNAIKFTQAGTVDLRVVPVDDTAEPPKLRFEVLDTGIGIAPEALVTLFEPFTQADPGITRQFGGTGLGLAISQHLVRQMGGEIRVESLPGRGSRFWFEMSFEKSSRAPVATDEAAATEGEPAVPALPALRVLAVDDNRLNRYTIDRILAREGALVELASDGREAMDRLLAGPDDFDIVLIDVQMPVMDGLSATRAIKANPLLSHLPVVALTAGVLLQQREAAEAAGVDGFVAKPVSRGRLIAALQAGLASRSQRPVRSHAPADGYTFGFAPAPSPP